MSAKIILEVKYALGKKKVVFDKSSTGKECVDLIVKKLRLAHPNLDVTDCSIYIPIHGTLREGIWLPPTTPLSGMHRRSFH
jgi:hypothetical protein